MNADLLANRRYTVAIIGGGVAGMSAAHELVERGFNVSVYEKQPEIPGGKARSVPVVGTGLDGREDLPGEHGFRFFPRFYKHVVNTMKRIPFRENANGVADNLVDATRARIALGGGKYYETAAGFPKSLQEVVEIVGAFDGGRFGLSQQEMYDYSLKMWQSLTSCDERIETEYEKLSAWEYLDADAHSEKYRELFCDQARALLAARPKVMSARVVAKITTQLYLGIALPGGSTDRILNGPTNDVWIDPWYEYLVAKGVDYNFNSAAQEIIFEDGRINRVKIARNGEETYAAADFYVFALPVEVMARLLTPQIVEAAPSLKGIEELSDDVAWMNGIQFYLNEAVKIVHGHTFYAGTPWALTSIEQHHFWPDYPLEQYGNGNVKGVLSIDISDWDMPGLLHNKPASECTPWEISQEVWHQLKLWVNKDGEELLRDDMLENWYLDGDIERDHSIETYSHNENAEPLLVNKPNTWSLRPNASTEIDNLFLASDYVRTYTELATMEAANEAARRAVNGILKQTNSDPEHFCQLWQLERPAFLQAFIQHDAKRFNAGLPWNGGIV